MKYLRTFQVINPKSTCQNIKYGRFNKIQQLLLTNFALNGVQKLTDIIFSLIDEVVKVQSSLVTCLGSHS